MKYLVFLTLYSKAKTNTNPDRDLTSILFYTKSEVPFYSKLLSDRKELSIELFPIINKQFIKEHQNEMISKKNLHRRYMDSIESANNSWTEKKTLKSDITIFEGLQMLYHLVIGDSIAQTTGGSSGEYFYQWFTLGDFWTGLYTFVKGWVNMGWKPTESVYLYYFHGANCVKLANHFQVPGFYSSIPRVDANGDITKESFDNFVKYIETKRPDLLVSFPSILYRICQLAYEENYIFNFKPKYIDLSADFLFTCQYDFIKSFFPETDIRLSYGTIEFGQIAQQIPGNLYTYKVYDDVAYVEQRHGSSKLIITSLIYKTQPIIRYELDDHGIVKKNNKSGETFIENLVGKATDKSINYIEIDTYINNFNNLYKANIINLRINTNTKSILITTTDEKKLAIIDETFSIPGISYKVIPMLCKKSDCITIDRYDRKNTPILKDYTK